MAGRFPGLVKQSGLPLAEVIRRSPDSGNGERDQADCALRGVGELVSALQNGHKLLVLPDASTVTVTRAQQPAEPPPLR